ncbi:MAG: RNA polymerase subunit sigma-24 [Asticcacaulis sp. 32-58-5]|nr:MAG: RNA polymerase subunit sigma-24 [Asticcacaulis sp. 32-58-5]
MTSDAEVSDEMLASSAARGDDRAFSILVGRHKEGVYRLLRRYNGNSDEAYEATHEAFIAAWKAIRRYDARRPFGAWLRTIAINKARDRGRRQKVRNLIFGTRSSDDFDVMNVTDLSLKADERLILEHDVSQLEKALARLPANLKEALLLTALEGYSQKQAAEILGVTSKTVETRVYRARKLLAEKLGEQ